MVRSDRARRGTRVQLDAVHALEPAAASVPRRLLLWLPPEAHAGDFPPGTWLRARVRIAEPGALRNPGGRRDAQRLARRGIGAVAQLVHPRWIARVGDARGLAASLHGFRRRVGARLSAQGEGGALLRALALGDAADLDPALRDDFAGLGVAHLLAVSGLHLALLTGAAFALCNALLRRSARLASRCDVRDVARIVALLCAVGYAGLTGFGTPVRRALVLVAVLVLCAARARRGPPLHALALAAGIVLVHDPAALFAPGAQLSFTACAALLLARDGHWPREDPEPRTLRRVIARTAGASAAAASATAPLAAWHFGTAAPLAVIVNLAAIPWAGFALMPAAFAAAAAAAWGGDSAVVSGVLLSTEALARGTLAAARALCALLPSGPVAPASGWVVAAAGAIALATLRLRHPLARSALATLQGLLLGCAPPATLRPEVPRLVALDVGRGDALLVQGHRGALLVDAGAAVEARFDLGATVVVPALHALGVRRLDLVVASHADLDHRGGLPAVLDALPVGALWLPFGASADPDFDALRDAAARNEVRVHERGRGSPPVRLGDLHVTPLWPPRVPAESGTTSRNERSLVLRVASGRRRVLLAGDLGAAESALVARSDPDALRADVLVLPHHGSRGSSSAALLRAVSPRVAVVSAPCPPSRGLPHADARARARAARASLWWTGRDGAVLLRLGEPLVAAPFAAVRDCGAEGSAPGSVARADAAPSSGRSRFR